MRTPFVALAAAALCASLAGFAAADPPAPNATPTPVNLPTLPPQSQINPYAKAAIDIITGVVRRELANQANAASGRVTYFKRFEMQLRTGPNQYRAVHLHQGTVINPTGTTIRPGMQASAGGVGQPDGSLNANVITIAQ
jgi:hypothetical protein